MAGKGAVGSRKVGRTRTVWRRKERWVIGTGLAVLFWSC